MCGVFGGAWWRSRVRSAVDSAAASAPIAMGPPARMLRELDEENAVKLRDERHHERRFSAAAWRWTGPFAGRGVAGSGLTGAARPRQKSESPACQCIRL